MKKILVLNPYIPTLGGGEKHMGYLCKNLEEYYKDVRIDILVHNYNEINIHDKNYVTIEKINKQFGLNLSKTYIKKIDVEPNSDIKRWLINKRKIEAITKEYDIFINFMFLSKHIGKAKTNIYACMFPPKKFIKEVQEGYLQKIAAKYLDWRFINSYKCFISNSQFTNHWLTEYWDERNKNYIVYPPVFSEEEIFNRYEEELKKDIIISVGRFFVGAHSKKQLDMIKFFVNNEDKLEGFEYHLVGAISNKNEDIEYLNEILEIAQKSDRVFIHTNCPFDKLIALYKEAKIFWHGTGYGEDENKNPDKMEHFGITTVEAMSFGAVPVVINKGGQKETVKEAYNGMLWNNEEECIRKTLQLINDDNLRKQLAESCVEEAKKYSIETFYENNRRIFNELQI
ncbi:MAG: glycosyltransferase family 4 protein [Zhenhengia sp.]|uniref:glycosyltransferase family 4 protein n=1 Tax=Zhenhengia sp. TaxID=2944208 RepID=UPI003990E751